MSEFAVETAALHHALEEALSHHFGVQRRIEQLERAPLYYRSSFALEEVDVHLGDGLELHLLFKDLSWSALSSAASLAKPTFLYDPRREIETYRRILSSHLPEAATCYGAVIDPNSDRYWLFLEKVPGVALYEVDIETWKQVAQWLAAMHTRFAQLPGLGDLAAASHLLHYDRDLYGVWPRRAQIFLPRHEPTLSTADQERFERLVADYDRVIDHLLALPQTLIHGEFYAANVLVQASMNQWRVCPVDWEMAALGPGLLDLTALIAGSWTEAEKQDIAFAYYTAFIESGGWQPTAEAFLFSLDCCRLHVAMQWLGWSAEWTPPPDQAQNWLAEALTVGERVLYRGETPSDRQCR